MAYFPRVGIELSAEANVRFLAGPITHKRPAHVVRFDGGASSGRFSTPARTLDFVVVFTGPTADMAVMDAFFNDHGVVVPFTIVHPKLGTGNAKLKLKDHQIEPVTGGETWWRIEIPIEGLF